MERNQRQPSKTSISSKSGNEKQAFSVCNALSGVEFSKGLRSYDKPPVENRQPTIPRTPSFMRRHQQQTTNAQPHIQHNGGAPLAVLNGNTNSATTERTGTQRHFSKEQEKSLVNRLYQPKGPAGQPTSVFQTKNPRNAVADGLNSLATAGIRATPRRGRGNENTMVVTTSDLPTDIPGPSSSSNASGEQSPQQGTSAGAETELTNIMEVTEDTATSSTY